MSASYHVTQLPPEDLSQALPLIQVTWPTADLQSWQAFVLGLIGRAEAGGVLALRDPSDYLCGILVYHSEPDLELRRVLAVPLFTIVDMGNSLRLAGLLLDAAENQACNLGCDSLRIRLHRDQSALSGRLLRLGLAVDGKSFTASLHSVQKSN